MNADDSAIGDSPSASNLATDFLSATAHSPASAWTSRAPAASPQNVSTPTLIFSIAGAMILILGDTTGAGHGQRSALFSGFGVFHSIKQGRVCISY
jgi:hypothetical protein